MATIISQNSSISVAGAVTLYTAASGGTVNLRALNAGADRTEVRVYLTASPESPGPADLIDTAKLDAGQALLLTGEPIKAGESVVIDPSGENINLSCRVSGFMEA